LVIDEVEGGNDAIALAESVEKRPGAGFDPMGGPVFGPQ
jgi:hypothetical protein